MNSDQGGTKNTTLGKEAATNDDFFDRMFPPSTVPLPPLPSTLDATKHAPTMRGRGKEATTATVPLPTDDPATWTIDGRPALAVAADAGEGEGAEGVSCV